MGESVCVCRCDFNVTEQILYKNRRTILRSRLVFKGKRRFKRRDIFLVGPFAALAGVLTSLAVGFEGPADTLKQATLPRLGQRRVDGRVYFVCTPPPLPYRGALTETVPRGSRSGFTI